MRKACVIILGCILFGANQPSSRGFNRAQSASSSADRKVDELVLVGTVTKLYPIAAHHSLRRWAVLVRVESVVSGEYRAATFTFTIHSPARAGLRVNRAYLIKATKADGVYVVNEFTLEEVRAQKKSPGKR